MGNTPNIRFKGFTDDWEQRKLMEVAEYRNGKAHENEINDDGEYIVVNSKFVSTNGEIRKFSYAQNEPLYENEIAFVLSDVPNGRAIARTFLVDKSGKYTLNQRIAGITPHEDTDPYYLYIKMNRNEYFLKFDDGNKQTNLSIKDVLNYEDMYPSYKEQQKIGMYFQQLDHLITLHQRKCDETKKLKKFMLQKMFPKKDAKKPEIRFAGFTNDWEQRKFANITMRESTVGVSSSTYPSVEYEDVIAGEGRLNKDIKYKEQQKTGIVFNGTQILYGKLRPYLHNWLNPDFSGIAVGDWWVLKPVETDKSFIYRLIQTQQFDDVANQSAGSKMPRADWNLVSNTEFRIPKTSEEQMAIGTYFSNLDHLITLHQRKCDELKEFKKYMLQNMFPQKG